ncbi:MAG: hypothetical protein ABSG05_00870 [Candidatus Pacearchaeota archaeon]|jgi:hypothetical protein
MEKIVKYNLGYQRDLPDGGTEQLRSEREMLSAVEIPLIKPEEIANADRLERRIEVHPGDHAGIMPCLFGYSVNIHAIRDGRDVWIGGETLNSNSLRKIIDKKHSEAASG